MRRSHGPAASRSEWIVAALSTLIVGAVIGYLLWTAISAPSQPAELTVRVEQVAPVRGGYVVRARVRNAGGATAEGAVISGSIRTEEGVERSSVTIDYVPPGSTRRIVLYFTRDPRLHPFRIRPQGHGAF